MRRDSWHALPILPDHLLNNQLIKIKPMPDRSINNPSGGWLVSEKDTQERLWEPSTCWCFISKAQFRMYMRVTLEFCISLFVCLIWNIWSRSYDSFVWANSIELIQLNSYCVGQTHASSETRETSQLHLSKLLLMQRNRLAGKRYPPSSAYMSSQVLVIGYCHYDWHGRKSMALPLWDLGQFCSLDSWPCRDSNSQTISRRNGKHFSFAPLGSV